MPSLVKRNKKSEFKKKHYIRIMRWTAHRCLVCFGYSKMPYLFETLIDDAPMFTVRGRKNSYAIFYDYIKFKQHFGEQSFDEQAALIMFMTAHEMRHYHQMRQLDSKKPYEDEELIKSWREDDSDNSSIEDWPSLSDYYKRPMEIDAMLFAYLFVYDMADRKMCFDYLDANYIDALRAHYKYLFGKDEAELFKIEE